jgi:hypothetical protein
MKPLKVVLAMQHSATTFPENGTMIKKSADATVFCFTVRAGRSRLAARQESAMRPIAGPGGPENWTELEKTEPTLNCDGDRHEEISFVSNGASNRIGFCSGG